MQLLAVLYADAAVAFKDGGGSEGDEEGVAEGLAMAGAGVESWRWFGWIFSAILRSWCSSFRFWGG